MIINTAASRTFKYSVRGYFTETSISSSYGSAATEQIFAKEIKGDTRRDEKRRKEQKGREETGR